MQLYLIRVPEYWEEINNKKLKKDPTDIVYEKRYDYTKSTPIKRLQSNDSTYVYEEVKKISNVDISEKELESVLVNLKSKICNYRIVDDIFLFNPYCTYEHDKEEIEIINLAIRKNKLNQICD